MENAQLLSKPKQKTLLSLIKIQFASNIKTFHLSMLLDQRMTHAKKEWRYVEVEQIIINKFAFLIRNNAP